MNFVFSIVGRYPKSIYIVVNSICNLKCRMCDIGQKVDSQFSRNMDTSAELSFMTIRNLIENNRYIKYVGITSTEPLLYKDLINLLMFLKNRGVTTQVTTNGYLFEKYADQLRPWIDMLYVSIDGPQNIHNLIRGRDDSYQRAIAGIRAFNAPEKTRINYTISNFNYFCISAFLQSAPDVSKIEFSHLNYVTEQQAKYHNEHYGGICTATPTCISGVDPRSVDTEILYDEMQKAKNYTNVAFIPEMDKEALDIFYKRPLEFVPGHNRCNAVKNTIQILADGEVTIATRCYNLHLGNINTQNLKNIIDSERMKKFKKEISKCGAFPACSRCCGVF